MNTKLILFLSLLLLTTTIVSAAENITVDDTAVHTDTTRQLSIDGHEKNIKKTPASSIHLNDAEAECYYGGRITYTADSTDDSEVNEGKISLYVNNTHITTENIADSIDWMYGEQYNQVFDNYPAGRYPMKIVYTNDGQSIESNNATLTINKGYANILVDGDVGVVDNKISIPVTVFTDATGTNIDHGKITASYNNNDITTINLNASQVQTILLPANYQQKTVKLTYSDTRNMLNNATEDVFLDVNIASSGKTNTTITVSDARIINQTHNQDNQTIYDAIAVQVDTTVNAMDEMVTVGHLTAYYNNNKIAKSNNTTSIIIPAKYNLEEIKLTYTGVDDYNDSTLIFTSMADKISTRTYSSYISNKKH